jgi:DNA-binding NtrC family response regulator
LQHVTERAVILSDDSLLCADAFLFRSGERHSPEKKEILNLKQLEREAVERAIKLSGGNMTRAAEYLGITRFALYRKLEKPDE